MEGPNDRLKILLQQYAEDTATEAEQQELFSLISNTNDADLESSLIAFLQTIRPDYNEARRQRILNSILDQVRPVVNLGRNGREETATRATPVRKIWRWVAAACIIALVGVLVFQHHVGVPANNRGNQTATTHDVPAPSNTRAVITLANGSKVYLDSVNTGTIAQQNNVNVVKNASGEVQYLSSSKEPNSQQLTAKSLAYNTLYNPRGSKVISLTLSDGTKVWLNSESSLRYPASFAPSAVTREVEITGEAYFEVKHNTKQPFKVHLPNGSTVEDIGTSFNINAYPDEDGLKTTLIEGSVRVVGGDANKVLRPGQQAVINQANPQITRIEVQTNVDIDAVLAWKNGFFQFSKASLQQVLRQLTRWYDVDVVYESEPQPRQFVGEMERTLSLQQVLNILEKNGVHFRIEGKKIIVMK